MLPRRAPRRSAALTEGPRRAPARAMLKAAGFTDGDLERPLIGVANTWIEIGPCNYHLKDLAARVKDGIRQAGGTPLEFNTVSISDGITMGTAGMKASLVSREVIADSIELVARGNLFDGLVVLVGCDKTIPGAVMALARLGSGDEVAELFHMLNPINHTRTVEAVHRYKAEPYVVAGDVYARAPHAGRAGWTWYTGSAAWLYRTGIESMLGLRRRGRWFGVNPCIPSSWPEYEITWTVDGTTYEITVENPDGVCRGVASTWLDGVLVEAQSIPLAADLRRHAVRVVMGTRESRADGPAALTTRSARRTR